MLKKALLASSLIFIAESAYSQTAEDSFEVCTYEGPCALHVLDNQTGAAVWLVTESSTDLTQIWTGDFWQIPDEEYDNLKSLIPESQRFTVPAVNPTTGVAMEKAGPKPKPAPEVSITGGGPLIGGSITVTVGSSGTCSSCHTGTMREIHRLVLPKKSS